jgi:hypothetical protein
MLVPAVMFWQVALAIHIAAVVVAFGVTFAYPIFAVVGEKLDRSAMPWFHRMTVQISRRLIGPGLAVVLIAGIYLASKLHQWHFFYVQWGVAVAIVLGALDGAFVSRSNARLAEMAERDLAAGGAWSAEYLKLRQRTAVVGSAMSLLVLVTVYLMAVQA